MRVIAVDDEHLALRSIEQAIREAVPACDLTVFGTPSKALSYAEQNHIDVAFLDIDMQGMNGLQLAIALKRIHPKVNVIFSTGYSQYAEDAISLRVSGFLKKPVSREAVELELKNLRHPVDIKVNTGVYVQTFGNFEVFVDGKPLAFGRLQTKEAFAFLVDRCGASVTPAELAAVLWEDKEYDRYLQNQTQKVIHYLMRLLRENGIEDIIIKSRNQIAIDKAKINCDYYDLLRWDASALNNFLGEYMANYSWAEMTTGALNDKLLNK